MEQNEENMNEDKPAILKAIDIIIAKPEDIKNEVVTLRSKYEKKYGSKKSEDQIIKLVSDKIISNYSYYTAFTGGATALTGVVPGLGTVIAAVGGATADAALTMKWEIEMCMALATIYGHDICIEEEKRLCYLIAGLGAINEAAKVGGKQVGSKAFVKMVQMYLKGPTLIAVKEVFKKVGLTFTRKALEKSIPFGVGVVVGFSANKGLTWYVGTKARDFFEARGDGDVDVDETPIVV